MPKHSLRTFIAGVVLAATAASVRAADPYDSTILNDKPLLFLSMDTPGSGTQADLSGNGHNGAYLGGTPTTATLPNGDPAADFNGSSEYVTVGNVANLSVPASGVLTIESWMRPDTLTFPHTEAEGYVYWLGKCSYSTGCEYANRMYSSNNTTGRGNRISDYEWNVSAGLGSGSYFQDALTAGQWIQVTDIIDMKDTSSAYPTGYIAIYKNGIFREKVALNQYNVVPGTTPTPFKVGTLTEDSFFEGAVGKVAVYNYVLSQTQISAHYAAMSQASTGSTGTGSSGSGGSGGSTGAISGSCAISAGAWENVAFASQNGVFEAQFDATPAAKGIDGLVGLANGSASAFTTLAASVRFNEGGTIDARNGGAYASAATIPYSAGTAYHFRLEVNVPAHTYNAYVRTGSAAEQTLASGYAFRTEQASVASLIDEAVNADSGSVQACNLTVGADTTPPAVSLTAPAAAAALSGTVTLTASASDSLGIKNVQMKLDGAALGSALTAAPYSYSWNTTTASNGSHALMATATDAAGNTATSAPVTVTVQNGPAGSGCLSSAEAWKTAAVTSQSGTFEEQFDATPEAAATDGVVGLSNGAASAFTNLATAVRFNETGTIDARDGAAYTAAASVPYAKGLTYHFRVDVNVPAKTYNAYVRVGTAAEQTIASNYAFRTGVTSSSPLNSLAAYADVGSESVCNAALSAWAPQTTTTAKIAVVPKMPTAPVLSKPLAAASIKKTK